LTPLGLYWPAVKLMGAAMRRTAGTVLLALGLGLVLTLAAAGCGGKPHRPGVATAGGGAQGGASASPTASVDPEEAQRQFAQCMREHGVDVPDPDSGDGPGIRIQASKGSANVEAAIQACQKYLPAGKLSTPSPEQLEQERQFAQCMRDHGINIPDPDPNGGGMRVSKGPGNGEGPGINPDDPAFKAAMDACKDKLPGMVTRQSGGGK
jgi:hypothetical protein